MSMDNPQRDELGLLLAKDHEPTYEPSELLQQLGAVHRRVAGDGVGVGDTLSPLYLIGNLAIAYVPIFALGVFVPAQIRIALRQGVDDHPACSTMLGQ